MPRVNAGGSAPPRSPAAGGLAVPRGSLGGAAPRATATRAARRSRRSCGSARGRRQRAARGPNEAAPRRGRTHSDRQRVAQLGHGSRAGRLPGAPAQFGTGAPAQFGTGAPAQFGTGAPAQFGGARTRSYPRANPSAEPSGAIESPPPAVRQSPYIRGNGLGGGSGTVERRAYPRAPEPPAPSAPRGNPLRAWRWRRGIRAAGPSSRRWQRRSAAVRPSSCGRRHLRRPGCPARRRRRFLGAAVDSALQSRIRCLTTAQRGLVASAAAAGVAAILIDGPTQVVLPRLARPPGQHRRALRDRGGARHPDRRPASPIPVTCRRSRPSTSTRPSTITRVLASRRRASSASSRRSGASS